MGERETLASETSVIEMYEDDYKKKLRSEENLLGTFNAKKKSKVVSCKFSLLDRSVCESEAQVEEPVKQLVKEMIDETTKKESKEKYLDSVSYDKKQDAEESESDNSEEYVDVEGGQEGLAEINDEDEEYKDIDSTESYEDPCEVNLKGDVDDEYESDRQKEKDEEEEEENFKENKNYEDKNDHEAKINGGLIQQVDKELDDDEDRRNPQYIPKRGAFYEHDDRASGEVENTKSAKDEIKEKKEADTEKKSQEGKKTRKPRKLWSDDGKWGHDMFVEEEQRPKTRDEVISAYGYDIKNEDGPPKARRRRKYGRGPNKYTRNWKDEEAYLKSNDTAFKGKGKNRNDEETNVAVHSGSKGRGSRSRKSFNDRDFPELISSNKEKKSNISNERPISGVWSKSKQKSTESYGHDERHFTSDHQSAQRDKKSRDNREKDRPRQDRIKVSEIKDKTHESNDNSKNRKFSNVENNSTKVEMVKTQTFENSRYSSRRGFLNKNEGCLEKIKARPRTNEKVSKEMGRAITKVNNLSDENEYIGRDSERKGRGSSLADKELRDEVKERRVLDDRTHRDDNRVDSNADSEKQNDSESNQFKPKRYSSLRQQQIAIEPRVDPRGLDVHGPTFQSNSHLNLNHQSPANQFFDQIEQPGNFYHETTQPSFAYMSSNGIEAPTANTHPTHFIPTMAPRFIPSNPQSAAPEPRFLSQVVPPPPVSASTPLAPVIAPGSTFLPSYPPGYPQFPPPHPTPAYTPLSPSATEVYRGGVTYYDTTTQQSAPRQLLQKRPRIAMPIIPP